MINSQFFDEIGEVNFVHGSGTKYYRIKLEAFKPVQVIIPRGGSLMGAKRTLENKLDWIKRKQKSVAGIENNYTVFKQDTVFTTYKHSLEIKFRKQGKPTTRINNGKLIVIFPENTDINTEESQAAIRHAITETLRLEAKKYLPKKVFQYAQKYGFKYNNITIKNHKSRWGSCSSLNNLNFNLHLMRLPEELIDYVVLHELVHTKVKNHSRNFWSELEMVCPNAKLLDKQLNNYRTIIF